MFSYKKFGEAVCQGRQNRRMTIAQLADATDKSISFITHVEQGNRKISLETAKEICDVLQISLERACNLALSDPSTQH